MSQPNSQQQENNVSSQIEEELHLLSADFHGTMEDCQSLIMTYNKLFTITRHLLREVTQLATIEGLDPSDVASVESYSQKMEDGLNICLILGESINQEGSLDDMIGRYLLGAKQEAASIVAKAYEQAASQGDGQGELREQLREKEEQVKRLETELARREQPTVETDVRILIGEDLERAKLEADDYVKTTMAEADRYSRKRKLIADDHVVFAQKEADEYATMRRQELRKEEERLTELTKRLQNQFEGKVEGVLTTISEYAAVESIKVD